MGNIQAERALIEEAAKVLAERLPPKWRANWQQVGWSRDDVWFDGWLRVTAPDGRRASMALEAKTRVEPRDALRIAGQAVRLGEPLVVVSPFLSEATRDRLREASLNWLDLTGNVRLALQNPGLFVEASGARKRPAGGERAARSLKGVSAGRVVRSLVAVPLPVGVRALADRAQIDAGYVSRILDLLDTAALIERGLRGRVDTVDRVRLVRSWAADAPLAKRGETGMFLEPRGLTSFVEKLRSSGIRFAITGSLAAQQWAPVAPPRLAQVYVDVGLTDAAKQVGLRPTDSGGNVQLIRPSDGNVLLEARLSQDALSYATPVQVAADLLTSPGRSPAEGEELLRWLAEQDERWRG